jgi:hypothetical protein
VGGSPMTRPRDALSRPRARVARQLSGDTRLNQDERIASWFERRADPGDEVYALCAAAALYGNVSSDPAFPYLWFDNVRNIDGAGARLAVLLASDAGPRFVVVHQQPTACDPSGDVARALSANYGRVATIDGIALHERRQHPVRAVADRPLRSRR